jgi:dipeptidase AC. Metallo peptidase. MEROPS family M19
MSDIFNIPVFDGHNDVLNKLWQHHQPNAVQAFLQGTGRGQMDLPRIRQGNMVGGIFATWVPSHPLIARSAPDLSDFPQEIIGAARDATFSMLALLLRIEQASEGQVKICRSVRDIRDCMARGVLAVVMHVEGRKRWIPTASYWISCMPAVFVRWGHCGVARINLVRACRSCIRHRRMSATA